MRGGGGGGGGDDKMMAILWDREEGKMPILSNYFIYDTGGQVN